MQQSATAFLNFAAIMEMYTCSMGFGTFFACLKQFVSEFLPKNIFFFFFLIYIEKS